MSSDTEDGDNREVDTRAEAEVEPLPEANELLARAARIRSRADELIAELGAEHPLVGQALARADALEREAKMPGQIHLRP